MISVLLTTYNRNDECIKCLNTLKPQITNNIELILLDDWHIKSDKLEQYCIENNFNYIHTGIQKGGVVKWRVPGYALNIGAKKSKGQYLILGNAEIFHISKDTIQKMQKTNIVSYPRLYDQPRSGVPLENYKTWKKLEGRYPFFMGVPRDIFFNIGGYDEDFTGYAYEDTDLCYRLELVIEYTEVDADAIHLWNSRGYNRAHAPNVNDKMFQHNKNLFYSRKGITTRNVDREWGIL